MYKDMIEVFQKFTLYSVFINFWLTEFHCISVKFSLPRSSENTHTSFLVHNFLLHTSLHPTNVMEQVCNNNFNFVSPLHSSQKWTNEITSIEISIFVMQLPYIRVTLPDPRFTSFVRCGAFEWIPKSAFEHLDYEKYTPLSAVSSQSDHFYFVEALA